MPNSAVLAQQIDRKKLEIVVRHSIGSETLSLRDWRVNQLGGGAGNPVSVGLFRVEGDGLDGNQLVSWSVILKIIQSPANVGWKNMGEGQDQTHWNYWKRELYIYQSDLLASLPAGLVAPRCFGVEDLPGENAWIWLEDIRDDYGGVWTLERYALTARHLGRLNGMYAGARLTHKYPWLGRNLIQQWASTDQAVWQSLPWEHPRVLARYPAGNAFRRMLQENPRFQAGLNSIPRTLCHGDTYPTNFMSRRLADGSEATVALDWALATTGAVGEDLGQFAYGAQMNMTQVNREEITETLFSAYLEGLQDVNCGIDPRVIRFGFTASAALRVGLFQIIMLEEELKQAQPAAEENNNPLNTSDRFEIRMAEEAYHLLEFVK